MINKLKIYKNGKVETIYDPNLSAKEKLKLIVLFNKIIKNVGVITCSFKFSVKTKRINQVAIMNSALGNMSDSSKKLVVLNSSYVYDKVTA